MLSPVLVLAAVAVGLVPVAAGLATARWPCRSPGAAIMLWQAMGLGWGVAGIGTLAALGADPGGPGVAAGAFTALDKAVRDVAGEARSPGIVGLMRPRLPALRRHRRTSAFNTPQALALTIPMLPSRWWVDRAGPVLGLRPGNPPRI